MSYTKILADKDYGNYLIDKCYQDEPFKFHDNNKSYADLKDLIDKRYIDDCSNYKGKSCIVIGNGGSVIESTKGDEIDKFDLVVRNNLARHEGFEKYVGSRTDVRFLSHKTFGNELAKSEFSAYDINYIPNSDPQHIFIRSVGNVGSMIPGFILNYNNEHTFSVLDLDYNFHLDRLASDRHFCTVGFSSVLTMLDLGCEVSIYGIDFYDTTKKFHYFEENADRIINSHNHSIKQEQDYINNLVKIGKIKVLQ